MAKAKIRNVISYEMYGDTWYDTCYESGIIRTTTAQNPNKTVLNFICHATKVNRYINNVRRREEVRYEA